MVSFGRALWGVWFIWVHSGAAWGPLNSFRRALGVAGLIRVRSGCRWFHWGSLDSVRCTLVDVLFIRAHNWGHRVHSGSLSSFGCIRARPEGGRVILVGWVNSCGSWGALGTFWRTLWTVGFILSPPGDPSVH